MGNAEMVALCSPNWVPIVHFFIRSEIAYATGIGDVLEPADNEHHSLEGYYLALVKPDVAVSTAEAYAGVTPKKPAKSCS